MNGDMIVIKSHICHRRFWFQTGKPISNMIKPEPTCETLYRSQNTGKLNRETGNRKLPVCWFQRGAIAPRTPHSAYLARGWVIRMLGPIPECLVIQYSQIHRSYQNGGSFSISRYTKSYQNGWIFNISRSKPF